MSNTATNYVTGSVTLVTTAETVVNTSNLIVENQPTGQGVCINGTVNVTAGAGTTAIVLTVRSGSLTGSIVGKAATHTLAAAASASIPYGVLDPTTTGNVQYVITLTQTGATGNGTVNQSSCQLEPSTSVS